jgi:predicted secreted hydrolase
VRPRQPRLLLLLGHMLLALVAAATGATSAQSASPVVPGVALRFPQDYGSHPDFGVEWWYLTGWLNADSGEQLGFQVTFFRSKVRDAPDNPSAFAAQQLLIAHCAISDPAHGRLWQDQRVRRAGMGLAEAQRPDTKVWIDDWKLERQGHQGRSQSQGDSYQTDIAAEDFALQLSLTVTEPVLLNGVNGYSQKGPMPASASYYYSQPQLRVAGNIARGGKRNAVTGIAWLDHEWSSQYLDPNADGWDWVGLNLNNGGALMAFRIRDHQGKTLWASATQRDARGQVNVFGADQIAFEPHRTWRSARTGILYPVSWRLRVGALELELDPLMDDQENDTRLSTGAIYWEGAVRVGESGNDAGRGYLELTGYEKPLTLR